MTRHILPEMVFESGKKRSLPRAIRRGTLHIAPVRGSCVAVCFT